ncbi:MAG: KH domain-containing protein [Proteobacteria bacterium]|nr:KH domain-containing protein [Pseudomonadota bacterium]
MKELVEKIVQALVDYPEDVDIREIEGPRTNILEIRVRKDDIGKLIGRGGKNISALRVVVAGAGKGRRYMVEVVEDDGQPSEGPPPEAAPDQDHD